MSSLITDPTARFVVALDASNDPDYPAINNKPLVWTNPFFVASPNTRISVKGVLGGAGTVSVYVGQRPEAKILSVPGSAVSLLCLYDVNDPDPDGNAVTSCQAFPNDPDDYLDDGTAYITKSIQIPAGYSQLYYRLFSGDSYASLSASARGPDMIVGAQQPLQLTVAGARALETVGVERNDPLTVHVLNGVNLQPSDRVTFADSKTGASVRRTLLGDTGANLQSADVQFTMAAPDAAGLYVASLYRADASGNDGQLLAGGPYLSIVTDTQTLGGTDVIQYYDLDAIGSVRRITQVGTSTVIRKDYQPFGAEYAENSSTSIGDRVMFAGKERDPESGLDYFGARYFGAFDGRFTSVDPALNVDRSLANPQLWNRYTYGMNNPLRYIDPSGASIELLGDEDERQRELEVLKRSVGAMGGRLYINEIGVGDKARYFVGIMGDIGDFTGAGSTAQSLANLVANSRVVEFGLTARDMSRWGGAATFAPGEDAGQNANTRVLVNPAQMGLVNTRLNPSTSVIGASRFAPNATWHPFNVEITLWHEFGHAWGNINGRSLNGSSTATNPEALDWENQMRERVYGPPWTE